MRWKVDRCYIFFLIFFYFFVFRNILEIKLSFFSYVDEIIAFLAFPLFLINLGKNRLNVKASIDWWIFVWLFVCIGLMGNVFFHYQDNLRNILLDAFLCIKFWLAIYVGKCIFSNFAISEYANKIYTHIRLVIWLYIGLIILDYITKIFPSLIRYGLRSTQLFYGHPTIFASFCILILSIIFTLRPYQEGIDKYFIITLILLCSTLRSKAFGAAVIYLIIYYIVYIRKRKFKLKIFLFIIPVIIIIARNQIIYYFFSSLQSESARYQLLTKSLEVAQDHFPLGAGFCTFASYYSSIDYSPLYYIYKLSKIYGLRKGEAFFISDSFWPMIIGQTGWIGLILMCCALLFLLMRIQKLGYYNKSYNVAGLIIIIYLFISSTAEAAFVSPIAIPLAIWLGFLLQDSHFEKKKL